MANGNVLAQAIMQLNKNILTIQNNKNLTTQQKQAALAKVWANHKTKTRG